jgi:hypothetical protein
VSQKGKGLVRRVDADKRHVDVPPIELDHDRLNGFEVEAMDGGIGKIDESSDEAGAGYIVVDTGPWIFGKEVLLPAGVIRDIGSANPRTASDSAATTGRAETTT